MKSRSVVAELNKANNMIYDIMINNLLLYMVVMHEKYGFGEKRLDEFLQAVVEKADEFEKMQIDETFDAKVGKEKERYMPQFRKLLCITGKSYIPKYFLSAAVKQKTPTFNDAARLRKKRERELSANSHVSLAEAERLQNFMKTVKGYNEEVIGNAGERILSRAAAALPEGQVGKDKK